MTSIVFYFQVHQPYRLKKFSFFDISKTNLPANKKLESLYFENDDVSNREIFHKVAQKCYYPATKLFLELVRKYPNFRLSFSLSGTFLEQCRDWDPKLLEIFQELVATGQVELIQETYYHSLSAIYSPEEFAIQIIKHRQLIWDLFGVMPTTFRNTELIYNNYIGDMIQSLGFDTVLIEGVDRILEWRSPNFVYQTSFNNAPKQNSKQNQIQMRDGKTFYQNQKHGSQYEHSKPSYEVNYELNTKEDLENDLDTDQLDPKNSLFSSKFGSVKNQSKVFSKATFSPKKWSELDTQKNCESKEFNEEILDKILEFGSVPSFSLQSDRLSDFRNSRVENRDQETLRKERLEDPKKALKKLVKKSILGENGDNNWGLLQEAQEKHLLEYNWSQLDMHSNFEPLRILTKNYTLSDDIAFRFGDKRWSEHPLTADKFAKWISQIRGAGQVVNLFMDYESFGEHQWAETGIFEFLRHLPEAIYKYSDLEFITPSETKKYSPFGSLDIPDFISWADSERDLSAWRSNNMQFEALNKIYQLRSRVIATKNSDIINTWQKLTTSDHYYYMCTKYWQDGNIHKYFSPYQSPYNAFLYFMNGYQNLIVELDKMELKIDPKVNQSQTTSIFSNTSSEQNSDIQLLSSHLTNTQSIKISTVSSAKNSISDQNLETRIFNRSFDFRPKSTKTEGENISDSTQNNKTQDSQPYSQMDRQIDFGKYLEQGLHDSLHGSLGDFSGDKNIANTVSTHISTPNKKEDNKNSLADLNQNKNQSNNQNISETQTEGVKFFPKTYYRSWQNSNTTKTDPTFGYGRSYLFRRISHKAAMIKKRKNEELDTFWDWVDRLNQKYEPIKDRLGKVFVTKKVIVPEPKKSQKKVLKKSKKHKLKQQ